MSILIVFKAITKIALCNTLHKIYDDTSRRLRHLFSMKWVCCKVVDATYCSLSIGNAGAHVSRGCGDQSIQVGDALFQLHLSFLLSDDDYVIYL